ncbi:hypothetical protein APHAL10511_004445 [Amanita phalloides]|nr:hypothetical protein APHAL10511_004445 [Amanita phalloides]
MSLLFVFLFFTIASGLSLEEPLNNQYPPIARIGQPFTWTFYDGTFKSDNGLLTYSAQDLPSWLSFDPPSRTFHGTPAAKDEGNQNIIVIANDGSSSLSSAAVLCVTSFPPPVLKLPLSVQLSNVEPSLSSVFPLSPHSAMDMGTPAVRVPPRWSFSIGFEGETFTAPNELFYYVRQANGATLPPWMNFNSATYALDGVAPHEELITEPYLIPLQFIASDQQGYSAATLPFNLIVASHEVSKGAAELPTLNITKGSPFTIAFQSTEDFTGILVDGRPIEPAEIAVLDIDVTQYSSWLRYDPGARLLYGNSTNSGLSPDEKHYLPVKLSTTFNQSIETNYAIAQVPSCFLMPNLLPLRAKPNVSLLFELSQYLDPTVPGESISFSASFEPTEASQWLKFDSSNLRLVGAIPGNSRITECSVTFSAYSTVTHATSYAHLPIVISPSEADVHGFGSAHHHKLSRAARAKLILAVWIVFGTLGGLCSLGASLAFFRRCARVEDTAIAGEDGRNALSARDRKWYGIVSPNSFEKPVIGYGWTIGASQSLDVTAAVAAESAISTAPQKLQRPLYGSVGLGLHPDSSRPVHVPIRAAPINPRVMKKKEFVSKIKSTVRQVSDKYRQVSEKYTRKQARAKNHPTIGKPILITPSKLDGCDVPSSQPGSTFILDSPSMSTGSHSIPRRRSDFGPPKSPAQVHFQENETMTRQTSSSSNQSLMSGILQAEAGERSQARPRLVPFTSANRVPVPQGQSIHSLSKDVGLSKAKRVSSQEAKVWKINTDGTTLAMPPESGSGDEFSMGLHYIQTLGGVGDSTPSVPTVATTNVRSSFSSLESSHQGHETGQVRRILVRMGEKFKSRIQIPIQTRGIFYELKLLNGGPLPQFLQHDINLKDGCIELYGTPNRRDVGVFDVGVYVGDRESCVARTIIDVVGRS